MSKADSRPAEEMSMEDILASIRKMIAQDQDVMDATRADRDSGLPSEEQAADDEVLDLIDELPEDGVTVREGTVLSDTPPAWDAPPEEDIADLTDGQADEPLDLETEFAIEESVPPLETAAESVQFEDPSWGPIDNAPPVQEPVTVGLKLVSDPVGHEDGGHEDGGREDGEPDLGDIPRFLDELPPAVDQTATFDEPDDSVVEPTTGQPVDAPDGMAHEPHEEVSSMDAPKERILSPEAAVKTSAAFGQLAQTLISGYDGDANTLEGVVRAMLKPLLKEWLDANLPRVVEEIVQAEIRRLAR